jgi:hypothetical protein
LSDEIDIQPGVSQSEKHLKVNNYLSTAIDRQIDINSDFLVWEKLNLSVE